MAQADRPNITAAFPIEGYQAIAELSVVRLHEIRQALDALADLTESGQTVRQQPEVDREELSSLFRLIARSAAAALTD